jgi:hypothetical protein
MHRYRHTLTWEAVVILCLFAQPVFGQAAPAKEYIRLGGRVIAIESPVQPSFNLNPAAASVSVIPGNSVANPILLTGMNFAGTVTFSFAGPPASGLTGSFAPATLTADGYTVPTLNVPANASAGTYPVTVTAASTSPSVIRTAQFNVVVTQPSATTPLSAVFGPGQYLTGPTPAAIAGLTTWRFETRLHLSNSLANGTSRVISIGTYRLLIYRYFTYSGQLSYSVILKGDGNNYELFTDSPDILIRVQRTGGVLSLKGWKVQADGSLAVIAEPSSYASASFTTSGFSLGAAIDEDSGDGRFPFNGQMAFFRYFDSAANNAALPDQCDTSPALLRYEFESNLNNAGTVSALLTPTGTIAYQLTPLTSCSIGGAPPAFSLIPTAQSPNPVAQGQSAAYPVVVNRQNFTNPVSLISCSGVAGVGCSAPVANGNTLQVTVNTASNTPIGTNQLTITASGAGVPNASATLPLAVVAAGPPPPTFTLQVNPNLVTFSPTGTQNLTATLFPGNGFTGNVNFVCAAAPGNTVPPGIACVAPNPASDVQPQRSFTISAAAGVAQGTYNLRLTGTGPQAQTAYASIQVTVAAGGVRAFIFPDYREISTNPAAYYQFQSAVENSSNSQVNWSLSPVSGGLTLSSPPSGTGTATAGPASYVFYRPPSSLPGGATTQSIVLSGAPAVGGATGNATLLLRNDPYAPPVVCALGSSTSPCNNETTLPGALSSSPNLLTYMILESHYTGTYGGIASDGRLHRTMRVSFALNPETPWDAGATSCLIRVERALGYGGPDGQTLYLEGGTQTASAALGTGLSGSITNGVCTIGLQYTTMSTNFSADPSKAWLTLYLRFNAASAPRYLFYKVETFNSTSSGTVLVKNTPLTVNP